jgi:hypothetical protein
MVDARYREMEIKKRKDEEEAKKLKEINLKKAKEEEARLLKEKKEKDELEKYENFLIPYEINIARQKEFQANKQEYRLRNFVTNFETGSELTLQQATALLQEKERQRLAFSTSAFTPLPLMQEEKEKALLEQERQRKRKAVILHICVTHI